MSDENNDQFKRGSDFWLLEIKGNVARLNDAASVVETDIVLPTRTSDDLSIGYKIEKIRTFQFEIRRLYKNANQILPNDIKSKLNSWFKATASVENITNIKLLVEGLKLSDELQDILYDKGVKDIAISEPIVFPYSYYLGVGG